jgi:hypothetical protein
LELTMFASLLWLTFNCTVWWGRYSVAAATTEEVGASNAVSDDKFVSTAYQKRSVGNMPDATYLLERRSWYNDILYSQVMEVLPELLVIKTTHTGGVTAIDSVSTVFTSATKFLILVRGTELSKRGDFVIFASERSSSKHMDDSAKTRRFQGAPTLQFADGKPLNLVETLTQAEQDCAETVEKTGAPVWEAMAAVVIGNLYDQHLEVFDLVASNKATYPSLWQLNSAGRLIFVWRKLSYFDVVDDISHAFHDLNARLDRIEEALTRALAQIKQTLDQLRQDLENIKIGRRVVCGEQVKLPSPESSAKEEYGSCKM